MVVGNRVSDILSALCCEFSIFSLISSFKEQKHRDGLTAASVKADAPLYASGKNNQ